MKADGHPLKPTGLKDWLRARGLFIECLCPLALDVTPRDPYSCRLVQNKSSGDVMAFCHFESDNRGCGMRGTFFFDWVFSSIDIFTLLDSQHHGYLGAHRAFFILCSFSDHQYVNFFGFSMLDDMLTHLKQLLGRRGSANPEVPMKNILALYEEKHQYNLSRAPHLDGYIGEQAVFYWPGTEQLASTLGFDSASVVTGRQCEYNYLL